MKVEQEDDLVLLASIIGVVGTIILVNKASQAQQQIAQGVSQVNSAYAQAQQTENTVNYASTHPLGTVWHEIESWFGAGPLASNAPSPYASAGYGGSQ
jgi:type II secretory pathway pseudopilin PulG